MTLLIFVMLSVLFLTGIVAARIYEVRKGRNLWRTFGLAGVLSWLEELFKKAADNIAHFDSKNIAEYLKTTWHVLKVFYLALQRLATEKIAENRLTPSQNGNRAASFYLKTIKEHKEKNHLEESEIKDKLGESE